MPTESSKNHEKKRPFDSSSGVVFVSHKRGQKKNDYLVKLSLTKNKEVAIQSMGLAIEEAVQLAHKLQSKGLVEIVKIETSSAPSEKKDPKEERERFDTKIKITVKKGPKYSFQDRK